MATLLNPYRPLLQGFPTLLLILIFTLTGACDGLVLENEPDNTNEDLFETVWNDIDRNYSYFPLKELDWDEVYAEFKPAAQQSASNEELFQAISGMLDQLKDIHVNLYITRSKFYSYTESSSYPDYPENYYPEIIEDRYLEDLTGFFPYRYGFIDGENIGYLHIISFGETQSFRNEITRILNEFRSVDGLIIDIRNNGGGSDTVSNFIAGFFTERELPYARIRWKNGPGHNDFTKWETKSFAPAADTTINTPVVLLTNRACFSSTESFVLAMTQIPRVTVIGDTTGGGSGNPIIRELPNGWTYRFSRWQMTTLEGTFFEGTGLPPDQAVWITPADSAAGRDPIIEQAILHLQTVNP